MKYHRQQSWMSYVCYLLVLLLGFTCSISETKCSDPTCGGNGVCRNDTCVCYEGWQGPQCQFCGGKVRLGSPSGIIYDGPGNYSTRAKCSWLIDAPNSSITLHIEEFATECGWDHLYVYDGDSVDSPLLAVFNGLMYKDKYSIRKIPEVAAHTGSVLLHFFTDDAYNMSGFNITYRLNACPSKVSDFDCSGYGICIDGVCTCDRRWGGVACHLLKCPNNCWSNESRGRCEPEIGCICNKAWKGEDCGQLAVMGYWETVIPHSFVSPGSASHGAVVWTDSMYVVAGESYKKGDMLYVYDFNGNIWETPHIMEDSTLPSPRYGHSTVLYGDKLTIYGGVLDNNGPTSELWTFDISDKTWENITVKAESCDGNFLLCGPLKSAGHTGTVVTSLNNKDADRMVVIFGYSPSLGYLNTVQEYYFGTREWRIVNTRGYPVKGGYGHTASWDRLTEKIYVYGGIVSEGELTQLLTGRLYLYDPDTFIWSLLAESPSPTLLHTATFVSPGLMLVFGGNNWSGSGGKCYSSGVLTYDVLCNNWGTLNIPLELQSDLARFGHSAVLFEGSLFIYGGFDGQMLSDMLKYTPGNCSHLTSFNTCLNTQLGVKCVWDHRNSKCVNIQDVPRSLLVDAEGFISRCPQEMGSSKAHTEIQKQERCDKSKYCTSCVQTASGCIWCGNGICAYDKCRDSSPAKGIITLDQCPVDAASTCKQLHNCRACASHASCTWNYESAKCTVLTQFLNTTEPTEQLQCATTCAEYTSCSNCTEEDCIWCQNKGRCIDRNAYTISFPYGQCRDWIYVSNKCRSQESDDKSQCSFYSTCAQCRDDPMCGWCDDGSKTRLGKCMPGGYAGPSLNTQWSSLNSCKPEKWHFTTCPTCQCNGHASCQVNTSTCNSCNDLTMGAHCERCIPGFWGNPLNGGRCQPCECNGQATQCHPESGKCYCTTKGVVGNHCEKCEVYNHYYGDPANKGTCYYELTTDYKFTFNLSRKADSNYTQINFKNSPPKPDYDADFQVTCSEMAKINITLRRANSEDEEPIFTGLNCTTFKTKFAESDYSFGVEDSGALTTFYVYIYDFRTPLWIQVSFAQHPKLKWQHLFMFSG